MKHSIIGLDFETYSATDLPKHGLYNYTSDPDFTPLLAAVVWCDTPAGVATYQGEIFDFVEDYEGERERLEEELKGAIIVAHNAGFEQAVLSRMGIHIPSHRFVDSAVLARAAGAGGKLEAAAAQLLGEDKLSIGFELIKLFSIPGQYQVDHGSMAFNPKLRVDFIDKWAEFANYCAVDAELSLKLAQQLMPHTTDRELSNNAVTMDMNNTGWHVDIDTVEMMLTRYQINLAQVEQDFRQFTGDKDLNLNSHPQLVEWCAKRGVRASSFDEAHVASLLKRLDKKLMVEKDFTKAANYGEVRLLLHTKQALGGSSLKKLTTILDTTGDDRRLHDQYLHCGAGATYRTTGRGVQMQNLKRLNGEGDDMAELLIEDNVWSNDRLASNLRQVFTATDPLGQLVVGDFSSVESRGLAWQAGEWWKLEAYAKGQDLYKVQAGLIFGKHADDVSKSERQIGKVGELACGYGAGADAVKDFAEKMGVILSEGEAAKLVKDWRAANPFIVEYWAQLDDALHKALTTHYVAWVKLPHGNVRLAPVAAPQSLKDQVGDQDLLSLRVHMFLRDGTEVLTRVIHGTSIKGRNIQYWKPSERKTGNLWSDEFVNPKTKRLQKYTVYGGKLAGLLTQSLCREVFFTSLRAVHEWCSHHINILLVGQFHDEIVLDWIPEPGAARLPQVMNALQVAMTTTSLPGFPLAADIKADYRYTK